MTAEVTLEFEFVQKTGSVRRSVAIRNAVVGGWTGRDKAALHHHIEELQKIGVAPPASTPVFYRVGVSRLVQADEIQVIGDGSSGEVEYVMLKHDGRIWIGAGSDHTDRHFERMGITVAKQLCDKPIAKALWAFDEIEAHWDQIVLRSYIAEQGERVLYQEGPISSLLSPRELLVEYAARGGALEQGILMFGGTCGAIGGVRYSPRFSLELFDPVLNRAITHSYAVQPVPIEG